MIDAVNDERSGERSRDRLTPRQAEVVRLAAAGLTAKETARRLGISKSTVNEYIRDAKRRVGASTKAELVGWLIASGAAEFAYAVTPDHHRLNLL